MISENKNPEPIPPLSKRQIMMPLMLALAVVVGIFIGLKLKNETLLTPLTRPKVQPDRLESISGQSRVEEILRYIDAKYLEEVNNDALVDKSINSILAELDPHSVFLPSDQVGSFSESLEGEFEGVGLECMILDDTVTVVTALADSPAARMGLQSGDKILAIDDSTAIGRDLVWLNQKMRGKRGSVLKLALIKDTDGRQTTVTIERSKIPIQSIDAAVMIDNNIAYIKISRFSANTGQEFMRELEKLVEKKGAKDLIIDLRGNPGGYLEKAVDVLSQIFPDKDKLMVYTQGRTVHKNEYKTTGRQRYNIGNVAILIDEGSASASEIVAGAIQDWDRGVVVGRRSFGKGLVQEPYALKDGSELRLTVARYFTPAGRNIQRPYKGKNYEIGINDTALGTKPVYKTASGRVVFGGGGITPDFYVTDDPVLSSDAFQKLQAWIGEFGYRYYVLHKRELRNYANWQQFQANFSISDNVFVSFLKYAERKGVRIDRQQAAQVKSAIRKRLQARIARILYGDEGYFGILNENDPCVATAIKALKQSDPLGLTKIRRKFN